jgi:hypothetical protein
VCALLEVVVHEYGWGGVACFQHVAEMLYGLVGGQQLAVVCTLFLLGRVEFLGKESESPEKIRAIIVMPRPSDVEGLRRFLGMVIYHSRFLPNHSSTTYSLRELLRKNSRFRWTAACEAVFIKLKREIASERILAP